ncbi:hypothetical protein FKM82_013451 [Ascaphus truei]
MRVRETIVMSKIDSGAAMIMGKHQYTNQRSISELDSAAIHPGWDFYLQSAAQYLSQQYEQKYSKDERQALIQRALQNAPRITRPTYTAVTFIAYKCIFG